jgi:hypothetical protein
MNFFLIGKEIVMYTSCEGMTSGIDNFVRNYLTDGNSGTDEDIAEQFLISTNQIHSNQDIVSVAHHVRRVISNMNKSGTKIIKLKTFGRKKKYAIRPDFGAKDLPKGLYWVSAKGPIAIEDLDILYASRIWQKLEKTYRGRTGYILQSGFTVDETMQALEKHISNIKHR